MNSVRLCININVFIGSRPIAFPFLSLIALWKQSSLGPTSVFSRMRCRTLEDRCAYSYLCLFILWIDSFSLSSPHPNHNDLPAVQGGSLTCLTILVCSKGWTIKINIINIALALLRGLKQTSLESWSCSRLIVHFNCWMLGQIWDVSSDLRPQCSYTCRHFMERSWTSSDEHDGIFLSWKPKTNLTAEFKKVY